MKREDVTERDIRNMLRNDIVIYEKEISDNDIPFVIRLCDYNDILVLQYFFKFDNDEYDIKYIQSKMRKVNNLIYRKKDKFKSGVATGVLNCEDYNTFFMIYFDKFKEGTSAEFISDINDIFITELDHVLDSYVNWDKEFMKKHSTFIKKLSSTNYVRPKEYYNMIVGNIKINQALQKEPISTLNQDHRSIVYRHLFYFYKKENIILMN